MLDIVRLDLAEFDEIKELFKSVFTAPPWNDDWSDDDQLDNYLKDLMIVRNPLVLGLVEDNVFIGVSIGNIRHWFRGTEYHIEELCIRNDKQGNGYGTKFMALIEEHVRDMGIDNMFLHTERSKPSYDFYRKLGFREVEGLVPLIKDL